jgi:hypothetical protein
MHCLSTGRHSDRRMFALCAVMTMVLTAACHRTASTPADESDRALKIDEVNVRTIDSGISVHYRTSTSINDCQAQAREMPKVWDLIVKPRLRESAVDRVILFPEDASLRSVSVEFRKGASDEWSVAVPCVIRIPVS